MTKKPTCAEIANSYHLWMNYADPGGLDTRSSFDLFTVERKIEILTECFGPEVRGEDT